jgi:hypothetical protein
MGCCTVVPDGMQKQTYPCHTESWGKHKYITRPEPSSMVWAVALHLMKNYINHHRIPHAQLIFNLLALSLKNQKYILSGGKETRQLWKGIQQGKMRFLTPGVKDEGFPPNSVLGYIFFVKGGNVGIKVNDQLRSYLKNRKGLKQDNPLSTRYGRQSTEGYAQGSRLSADRCASYELDGDARQTRSFIQVRPPWGRNTYVLRQIVLLWRDVMRCVLRGSPARFI